MSERVSRVCQVPTFLCGVVPALNKALVARLPQSIMHSFCCLRCVPASPTVLCSLHFLFFLLHHRLHLLLLSISITIVIRNMIALSMVLLCAASACPHARAPGAWRRGVLLATPGCCATGAQRSGPPRRLSEAERPG